MRKRKSQPPELAPLRIRLTLDRGLAAYIRAYVKAVGIYGDERETIIAMVRNEVIRFTESQHIRAAIMPHLPRNIQRAWKGR